MITVSARVLGRKGSGGSFSVPPPPGVGEQPIPVAALLGHVVRQEVSAFRARQEGRALLEVLTPEEIAGRAAQGRVVPGGQDLRQEVDEGAAVAAVLQAFEDGIYMAVLDGHELRDLGEEVTLRPDSQVTFLRLTLLEGG
jgi:hypothetical protein